MTKPISPDILYSKKPDEVFEVFNELILENWDGTEAIVKLKHAVARLGRKMRLTNKEIYDMGILDIEAAYEEKGWHVTYSMPAYNETHYDHFFRFSKTKGTR